MNGLKVLENNGWSQSGGPGVVLSSRVVSQPTFTAPGVSTVLTFTLVVTDARGLASAPAQTVVTVHDTGITTLSASNDSPTTLGQATALTATAGGSNIGYVWSFGDGGSPVSGALVTHTYGLAGHYTATVTATNSVSRKIARRRSGNGCDSVSDRANSGLSNARIPDPARTPVRLPNPDAGRGSLVKSRVSNVRYVRGSATNTPNIQPRRRTSTVAFAEWAKPR